MVCEQVRCRTQGQQEEEPEPEGSAENAQSFHPSRSASVRSTSAHLLLNASACKRKPYQDDAENDAPDRSQSTARTDGGRRARRGGEEEATLTRACQSGGQGTAGRWTSWSESCRIRERKKRGGGGRPCRLNCSFLSPVLAGRRRSLRRMKSASS